MNFLKEIYHRFLLEIGPMGLTNSYILFPIKKILKRCGIGFKGYKDIDSIIGTAETKRVFIISTGPSLKLEDIQLIKNEDSISMNTIFRLFDKTEWRPTYYVMTDHILQQKLDKDVKLDFDNYAKKNCILNVINKKISKGENIFFIENCWLDHCVRYGKSKRFKFEKRPSLGVYDYYSATQECIYYAILMGYKEIYLLGADNDYLGKKQHFSNDASVVHLSNERAVLSQNANNYGYEYIRKIAEKYDAKIFNATRGGALELFPRVKLEDITNNGI